MTTAAPTGLDATAWLAGLRVGRPPAIGYVVGHRYHAPDGHIVRVLPDHGTTSIARLGDGFLATSDQYFEGTTAIYRLDRSGRVLASGTVSSPPVLSADGRTLHWLTFTPPETGLERPTRLHRADVTTGATSSVALHVAPAFLTSVVGVVDGTAVLTTGWGGRTGTWLAPASGAPRRVRALDGATAVAPSARLVALRTGKDHHALEVVDLASRDPLWHAEGTYPVAFSPSGRRLLAFEGRRLVVLDARTGDLSRVLPRPSYRRGAWLSEQLAWEDERHLLAGVDLPHRTAVVRIDVATGELSTAIDWTPSEGTYGVAFETSR